jgi:ABC-type amino acid transport substrate-binding protein
MAFPMFCVDTRACIKSSADPHVELGRNRPFSWFFASHVTVVSAAKQAMRGWRKERFTMSLVRNFKPLNLSKRLKSPPPEQPTKPATFLDIIMLVAVLVLAVIGGSIVYDGGLLQELSRQEDQLRGLKERADTLQLELANAQLLSHQNDLEAATPHHMSDLLDVQVIGSHTSVSWKYSKHDDGKHVGYELQLLRLDPPDDACIKEGTDFFSCSEGPAAKRFIASDVQGQASRIPPTFETTLSPGRYAWRVAAIPTGSAISEDPNKDAQTRLSEWSAFASFTLYRSQLNRILTTRHVRIGTNLEQSTPFSRRDPNGHVVGFDIALVYTLVEDCLSTTSTSIYFDAARCQAAVTQPGLRSVSESETCSPSITTLCVTLVPVHKWKNWETALKRKDIDMFVGGISRASARQRGGIVFTEPYLYYDTKVYTRSTDASVAPTLSSWLTKTRSVGVIQGSTNEQLLMSLQHTLPEAQRKYLVPQTVPSFPALESAMDAGEVDGVIIDDTFVNEPGWVALRGLTDKLRAPYLSDYIGGNKREEIAMAVTVDEAINPTISGRKHSLFAALQEALSKPSVIVKRYIPQLCANYWSSPASDYKCLTVPKEN